MTPCSPRTPGALHDQAAPKKAQREARRTAAAPRPPAGICIEEEIGLGDVIKRTSSYLGIRPCGGCGRRAGALNRWLVFSRRAK